MEALNVASFMMIRLVPDNCKCPVKLFREKKADHLMGECHF